MAQENCYTYNGLLSPTDREWFTLGTDGDGNDIAADSIRAAGCGVCDAMLPAEAQGGTESASTVCKVNGDCQAEHYCDKRSVGGADTCGILYQSSLWPPIVEENSGTTRFTSVTASEVVSTSYILKMSPPEPHASSHPVTPSHWPTK